MPEPSLSVLSGDVHHSYAARAEWAGDTAQPAGAMVYQLVCSPVNNYVPAFVKPAFTLGWSRPAAALADGGHADAASPRFRCPGRTPAVHCSGTPSPLCKWTAAAPRCFSSSPVARMHWTKSAACRSVDRPDAETA